MKNLVFDMRGSIWYSLVSVGFAGFLLTACSRETGNETIVIRGSNTVGEELAPRLIAEFKKQNPNVAFDLEFKGTSYGLGALLVERCDLAAASRDLTTNEMALARDRNIELNSYVIGTYGVEVIVHANNPVTTLTRDRVRDIFTGTITNWIALGGENAPISLYIRDPISGTYLGFQELALDKKAYATRLKTMTNYVGILQAVAKDPNGIGFSSIGRPKAGKIKAVSISGVYPSVDNVNEGLYPYARLLRFYTTKTGETPEVRRFIDFVQSEEGQQIVKELGFAPRS